MKTTVGQVLVVGGHVYAEAPNVLLAERSARLAGSHSRERGQLYVLVEAPGRAPAGDTENLAGQIAGVIHQAYYSRPGSVTAGLQHAVREANRLLFEENRNSLPGERRTAGLCCAVLRDDDLFLAQAGPAAAFVVHDGQAARFPQVSSWLDNIPAEELDAAPLGDRSDTGVALYHAQLVPGDTVLLLDSAAARCLAGDEEESIWAALLAARQSGGCRALLDALPDALPDCDLSAIAMAVGDESMAQQPAAKSRPTAAQPTGPTAGERVGGWLRGLDLGDRLRAAGRGLVAALAGLWAILAPLFRRLMPGRVVDARAPAPRSAQGSGTRRSAAGSRTETGHSRPAGRQAAELEPARSGTARRQPRGSTRTSDPLQKVLVGVAIAIPLIVAVVVAITLVQRGQERRAELDTLRQQANASWTQANSTAIDRAAAQRALEAARSSLDQILSREPDDAAAQEMRGKVLARLDEMGQVKRIRLLAELNTYPTDARIERVIVQGLHVFVLDRQGGRVYHHQLDGSQKALTAESRATVLVSSGQQVGGTLVGDLVDMVWMGIDAGNVRQRSALVILESGGTLLEYDPTTDELNALVVGGRDAWSYPAQVGSHTGRFYLLDTGANKIWRYNPTRDGYADPPDDWLQTEVDLAGLVDAVIGDGIYLVYADGRLLKLSAGQPAAYGFTDWDKPPSGATALAAYPPDETEWLYVADSGNRRIVQTTPAGQFKRQYQVDASLDGSALGNVSSLFVDDSVNKAYIGSGNRLYLAALPE